jgi:hypothetical protein
VSQEPGIAAIKLAVMMTTGEKDRQRVQKAAMELARRGFTADEVCEFHSRLWELCPRAADQLRAQPTIDELLSHIHLVRRIPARSTSEPESFYKKGRLGGPAEDKIIHRMRHSR